MERRTISHSFFRWSAAALAAYALFCVLAGIALGNVYTHLHRQPLANVASFQVRIAKQFHARVEDVSIHAIDGAVLKGWLLTPPDSNGESVIVLHGIASNRISSSGFADIFLREGFSVLLPDSREHGESGGNMVTFGIRERDDVRRWTSFIRNRAPGCTYLLGESLGAAIGLQATAVAPQLCAVAVESPYATFRQVSYERLAWQTHTPIWLWRTAGRPIVEVAIVYDRLRYGVYLPDAEPKSSVEHSSVPTLLIAGTKDQAIRMHHAQDLESACASHCALWIVPGADHGGAASVAPQEFHDRVLTWFETHDRRRGSSHPAQVLQQQVASTASTSSD